MDWFRIVFLTHNETILMPIFLMEYGIFLMIDDHHWGCTSGK